MQVRLGRLLFQAPSPPPRRMFLATRWVVWNSPPESTVARGSTRALRGSRRNTTWVASSARWASPISRRQVDVDQVQVAPGHLIEPLLRPGLHIGAQEPSLVLPFVPPFALFSVCSMSAAARDRTKTVYPIGSVFGLPRVRVRMQQARLQAHGPQRRNVVFRTSQIRPRVATRNRQKSIRPLA